MAGTAIIGIRYSGRDSPSITEHPCIGTGNEANSKSVNRDPVTAVNVSASPTVPASKSDKVNVFWRKRIRVIQQVQNSIKTAITRSTINGNNWNVENPNRSREDVAKQIGHP